MIEASFCDGQKFAAEASRERVERSKIRVAKEVIDSGGRTARVGENFRPVGSSLAGREGLISFGLKAIQTFSHQRSDSMNLLIRSWKEAKARIRQRQHRLSDEEDW